MTTATTQAFRLPDLGEGLTEAGLVQWLVCVGDTIAVDQPVAEVETAKSVVELPSPFAGVVSALHGEEGEALAVGAVVLEVTASSDSGKGASAGQEKEAYRTEERAGSGNVLIGYGTAERAGSGRRRARASARSGPSTGSGTQRSNGPSTSSGTQGGNEASRSPVAVRSPLVRRLARDLGVDVRTIAGTGSDGAITRSDVLRAAVDHAVDDVTASPASDSPTTVDGLAVAARERLSPLRRAISAKLSRSRSEIPEATVWVDVDATELWELRQQMARPGDKAASITALVARFVLTALAEYPLLASRLNEDATEIISFDGINLGVAADTDRGLMVPVIPHAQALSIDELDDRLRELAQTARAGTMAPDRLRGSTFTLNNYGGLGVDGSAAIINHPDVAILGIGRMIERAWVVEGEIVVRRIAQLSLVFDHRVCDGGYAAGFLRRVVELIEHPLRAFGSLR